MKAACPSTLMEAPCCAAGAGPGVHQEADGLYLHQAGAELAGRPHAREQEEDSGGRRRRGGDTHTNGSSLTI